MNIIILVVNILLVIVFIVMFNRLVRLRHLVKEAWSGIDVQLKKRHDLIPNIVEAVKGYKEYEQKVHVDVTSLRSKIKNTSNNIQEKSRMENEFSQGLKNIFAVAEAYPDLKSNKVFLDLHKTLVAVEDDLQMARRYYNGTVRDLNIMVESFPVNLIAGMFNICSLDYFEIQFATERQVPDVKM